MTMSKRVIFIPTDLPADRTKVVDIRRYYLGVAKENKQESEKTSTLLSWLLPDPNRKNPLFYHDLVEKYAS